MKLLRRNTLAVAAVAAVITLPLGASPAAAAGGLPLPAHLYAPYFEAWTTDSISALAQQSGARYLTLAFIQAPTKGSCVPTWNGDATQTMAAGRYLSDLATLRSMGGDIVPSFGGFSADHSGTEIADSCTDVNQLAAAYESVVTTYDVTRLDMDVESNSLNNAAGIDRRNKALTLVENWAAGQGRTLQLQYTLPVEPAGLEANGLAVLQNAVANNTRVDVVNIMTFDYYDRTTTDMGAAAISAAQGLYGQLASLYPTKTPAQLWSMQGNTILPGIDDYPKKTEVTYEPDATTMLNFAQANNMNFLSVWAIQRDNGGCPGTRDSNTCSGITQNPWDFSHLLRPFTS